MAGSPEEAASRHAAGDASEPTGIIGDSAHDDERDLRSPRSSEVLAADGPSRRRWLDRRAAVAVGVGALTFVAVTLVAALRATEVPLEADALILAMDASLSSEATDIAPSRFEAEKMEARSFVESLPPAVAVGLVSFSGEVDLVVSPTTDHDAVRRAVSDLTLRPATAIGEAIFKALDARPAAARQLGARIVVVSDGDTTVGRFNEDAAAAAVAAGVPVSTIALGTPNGVVFVDGAEVAVPVEGAGLRQIAITTGGTFYEARSASELRGAFADIRASLGGRRVRDGVGLALIGLAVVIAAAAGSLAWFVTGWLRRIRTPDSAV